MLSRHLGFQRVIFDCDMTLVIVEGIDELARLKRQAEYIARLELLKSAEAAQAKVIHGLLAAELRALEPIIKVR